MVEHRAEWEIVKHRVEWEHIVEWEWESRVGKQPLVVAAGGIYRWWDSQHTAKVKLTTHC